MNIDELNKKVQHEVDLYLADNAMSPRQLADRCAIAGLEAAKAKCLYMAGEVDIVYEDLSDALTEAASQINQLITEAKQ